MIDEERFPRLAARLQMNVPKEKVAQIHEFVKDLAVGYDEGIWDPIFFIYARPNKEEQWDLERGKESFKELCSNKWDDNIPRLHGILSLEYLNELRENYFFLSAKALSLVDEPVTPPNVFISYKRSESSAFALLLEARIKYETNATPFLDKSLEPGDDWHPKLEEKVKSCGVFVCVIGPITLDSPYVLNEIRWAQNGGKNSLILPVWHKEYDGTHENDTIKSKQAVVVVGENAKGYDSAVNEVLNRLGYSPQFIAQRQSG